MLNAAQRRTLAAVCDTFVESASDLGVPAAVEEAIAAAPRAADRRQTALLLQVFGTRGLTALGGGGAKRFEHLPREEREAVLLSWADSKVPQRRAVFQALRKACTVFAYLLPTDAAGAPNPLWESIGYPGAPENGRPAAPLHPLEVIRPSGETQLDCDVVVVGSGAGGGVAAKVLAEAGLDVIVVEAGGYHAEDEFDGLELTGFQNLYLGGGGIASDDQSIGLLAGSTLGGGTVVNYSTSFRTPDDVREEWARLGFTAAAGDEYGAALDAVCERTGVNQEHNRPSSRDHTMHRGLQELGWHSDFMPRNVRECEQGARCGFCGFGCPYGAKQSGIVTWLPDAAAAGARLLVETHVERILTADGAAAGVEATHHPSGARVRIRSRAVVAAAGAINTPALLRRSGLTNPNIGRHLRLHPAAAIFGVFDEELAPWEGTMQAIYSDEHRDLDGEGYGLKYETAPLQPWIVLTFAPWRSARQSAELMQALGSTSAVGVLLRDKDSGEVRVGRDGQPIVRYRLSERDARHLHVGVEGAAKILKAAGAQWIYTPHTQLVETRTGDVDALVRDASAAGYGSAQITLGSFHIMGSARMAGHPTLGACDPTGQTYDVRDVVVCDASTFPTATGVNPQISIMSIAYMNAQHLAARLTS